MTGTEIVVLTIMLAAGGTFSIIGTAELWGYYAEKGRHKFLHEHAERIK